MSDNVTTSVGLSTTTEILWINLKVSSDALEAAALPCSVDKAVRVCPVGEQVTGFHIIYSDVHVCEGLGEKVVDFPRHIQNVANAEKHRQTQC